MSMQFRNCAVGQVVEQRPPVLLFTGRSGRGEASASAEHIWSEVCDLVLSGCSPCATSSAMDDACTAFYRAWRDLECEYNSCSIGVIAVTAPETDAVARIISEGIAGGPLPGAIALARFDGTFFDLCRQLSAGVREATGAAGKPSRTFASATPFEWPPMVVFLPTNNSDVLACAKACRTLRAGHVPINLEMVPSGQDVDEASRQELRDELENFFAANLMPVFPTLV